MTRPDDVDAGWRLILDTATRRTVVALARGSSVGPAAAQDSPGRHGGSVLGLLDALLAGNGLRPGDLAAVGVGVGPGSFTGLRIGLAVAKTLAWTLRIPLVGLPTGEVLARSLDAGGALGELAVVLPAGARDHYLAIGGRQAELVGPDRSIAAALGGIPALAVDVAQERLIGVTGPGGHTPLEAGELALGDLATGAAVVLDSRLREGQRDDPSTIVPMYVATPRGARASQEAMAWSPAVG